MDVGNVVVRRATAAGDLSQAFGVAAPRPMPDAMADISFGPVVVLEAETGSGKTEAALRRFVHLWRAGEVDALHFGLSKHVAASPRRSCTGGYITAFNGSGRLIRPGSCALAADAQTSALQPIPHERGFTFPLGAAQYRDTRLAVKRVTTT